MRPSPLVVAFAVFGMAWGAWQATLPDLATHYGLTPGPLGVLLTAGFAASLPVMLLTGRLLDRLGAGWAIGITGVAMAGGLAAAGFLPPLAGLVMAVIAFASGSGAFDVAINGTAMTDEVWRRPARLTLLHAAFSGGGLAGAVAAGVLIGGGVPFQLIYLGLAGLLLGVAAIAGTAQWRRPSAGGSVPRAIAVAMLPLAGLAALAFLVEGSMETWSAIFLRRELDAVAFVGALGPAAFHGAMLAGRLVGAALARGLGASTTLLVAGTTIVGGMAVALLVPSAGPAIIGMGVAALGASFVVPVVVSLAAARAGAFAGRAASYVLSLGYAGFLVGPSVVGIVAEVAGLHAALAVVPFAAAVIAAASRTRVARG